MPLIHIVQAEGEAFDHEIEGDSLVIGRSSRCDLAVLDRCLSRQHVRIFKSDDDWMVEDLGSRNGTTLNGLQVSNPTRLRIGDTIAASMSEITFGGPGLFGNHPASGDSRARISESSDTDSQTIFRAASDILADSERELAGAAFAASDELQRAATQLRVLNDIHQSLAGATTTEELFAEILDRVFAHFRPQNAAVFVKDGDRLIRAATRSAVGCTEDFPESSSLAREVIDKGLAAVVHDTSTDMRFAGSESLLDAGVRTLVAAPLLTRKLALGMIVLSSTLAERQFAESDMEMLTVVASATGLRLRNLALAEEAAERQRFERELAIARRIQVALLPAAMPEVPGVRIHGGNTPSRGVSGDYFQVVDRPEQHEVALVIADVSGKGIGASLLTGYVDALVIAYLGENLEPDEIFNRISPQMHAKTPVEAFATAFLGIYSTDTGKLRFASAGHDPALLVRSSGEVELLRPTGMPLGLMPEAHYTATEAAMGIGDTLVLYTDGITEAANLEEDEFGRKRLTATCIENRTRTAEELATSIHQRVHLHVDGVPYHDDRTLVILQRVE